jgi:crotonobetainyl-CoA:carnitine CoA-transferase CaiB-like acyl-CoA transferase
MHTPAFDNESPRPTPGPPNGIRVLDISTVYAAPITAMVLVTTALMFSRSSIRAGTLEKWGLGPHRMHQVNPALVIRA